ncbi:hypothetical protein B188_17460 [Candidatus Brocadiaceae bacterium B188]|nr:DUF2127 domain-containing protein [Candidatus Brocadia sapporoensis]QQR66798.1 MAG: DUF2127 domain-containing protein [Candidatus Brocadia sp.]RZV59236.1 MAG: DUF2127 domain-containing protein [Candidatus Brocadia sp. BROELEC01]TWU53769.1 hypothetical protein B188_17460 [Candidatus Brocadiaceae bacterium B188]
MDTTRTIKLVAMFEALKGLVALSAASGVLMLIHKDLHTLAIRLVEHAHLNPASKFPNIFIIAAGHLQNGRLLLLAVGAAAYSAIRIVEAYGLFYGRIWAELFAAISGAVYIPFEIVALIRHAGWTSLGALLANAVVVYIIVNAMERGRSVNIGRRPN